MNKLTSLLVPASFLLSLTAVSVVVINPIPGPAGSSGTQGIIGSSGATGPTGPVGPQGESGATGATGEPGESGEDGLTPYIGENGYWWIGEVDTGVRATPLSSSDPVDSLQYRHTELNLLAKYAEPLSNVLPNLTNQAAYVLDRVNQDGFTIIDSPTALMTLANPLGKYVLDRNLDLSTLSNWSPITFLEGFQGTLDGAGYQLSGLNTASIDTNVLGISPIGLFSQLVGATVRHLRLHDFTIQAPSSYVVGTLAGDSTKTHFYNLSVTSSNVEGFRVVGGLVGNSVMDLGDEISVNSTTVQGEANIGGVAGYTYRSAWIQILTGGQNEIITKENNAGGFFGFAGNIVLLNSASYGFIRLSLTTPYTFIYSIGGVVGELLQSFVHGITNYAMVDLPLIPTILEISNVGGIVGRAFFSQIWYATNDAHVFVRANDITPFYIESVGGIVGDGEMVEILYNINLGPVDVISPNTQNTVELTEYVAGLIGYQRGSGAILNSVNLGAIQGFREVGGLVGGTGFALEMWSQLEIRESMNLGVIRGIDSVGGLVGNIDNFYELIIEDSFNDGDIFGEFVVGGLVGFIGTNLGSHSKIIRSYNAGTLTGNVVIGGLVGAAAPNFFDNQITSGKLSIEYAFNVGQIIVEELGIMQFMNQFSDYREFAVGAIMGVRYSIGEWQLVTYVAETTVVPVRYYDEITNDIVVTDVLFEATLYATGDGYGFDAFSVSDVSAYGRNDFFYADYWNLNQVWDVDHLYDTYDLPILRRNAFNFLVF